MALLILDATGTQQILSSTVDNNGNIVGATCITDPGASGAKLNVGTRHAGDGAAIGSDNSVSVAAAGMRYNGTAWDRERGNVDTGALVTLVNAAGSTTNSADQVNYNGRGLQVAINLTAIGATTTLTITVQGKDTASGQYYTLLASAAISAAGFTTLTVYPGLTAAANSVANQVLPRTWRVTAQVSGSNTASATVSASVII